MNLGQSATDLDSLANEIAWHKFVFRSSDFIGQRIKVSCRLTWFLRQNHGIEFIDWNDRCEIIYIAKDMPLCIMAQSYNHKESTKFWKLVKRIIDLYMQKLLIDFCRGRTNGVSGVSWDTHDFINLSFKNAIKPKISQFWWCADLTGYTWIWPLAQPLDFWNIKMLWCFQN